MGKKKRADRIPVDYDQHATQGKAALILEKVAGTDEPVFILRAKDLLSVPTMIHYLNLTGQFMPRDTDLEAGITDAIEGFREWQQQHTDLVKWPD